MSDYLDKRNGAMEFSNSHHLLQELEVVRKQWRLTLAENETLKEIVKDYSDRNRILEIQLKSLIHPKG